MRRYRDPAQVVIKSGMDYKQDNPDLRLTTTDNAPIEAPDYNRDQKGLLLPGHALSNKGISTRSNAGATLMNQIAYLSGKTPEQLKTIAADDDAPLLRIAAARWLLRCGDDNMLKSGAAAAGPEIDRLLDRTLGRPQQHIELDVDTRQQHLVTMTDEALAQLDDLVDEER